MTYSWDPSKELHDYESGVVPSHRLYGGPDLAAAGYDVSYCSWGKAPKRIRRQQLWKIWQAIWLATRQYRFDVVVCGTEASSLPVLLLRRLGILRRPVVVLSVAVLAPPYVGDDLGARARRALIRSADMVTAYSRSQVPMLHSSVGLAHQRVRYIGFGVDVNFFQPQTRTRDRDVIAVGTNAGKDYPTLVRALPDRATCLIVTDQQNIDEISAVGQPASVVTDHDVPIAELRIRYAASGYTVIPLRDVSYSSGQTVLLENLAMGRPVIVSDVPIIRDYVTEDMVTLVPAGDVGAMRRALEAEPPASIPAAAKFVRDRFSSTRFAADLADLCSELVVENRPCDL